MRPSKVCLILDSLDISYYYFWSFFDNLVINNGLLLKPGQATMPGPMGAMHGPMGGYPMMGPMMITTMMMMMMKMTTTAQTVVLLLTTIATLLVMKIIITIII